MVTLEAKFDKTNRACGDCQLCCRIMPVEEIAKPALQRCKHQKSHCGCAIYPRRPLSCRIWSCAWLTDAETVDLPRPDRAHYVVDCWPDTIRLTDVTLPGGNVEQAAIQVWCDPAYPEAWDNPKLKAYLDKRCMPAIIRYGNNKGFVVFPPSYYGGDEWKRFDVEPTPREFFMSKNQLSGPR